MRLNTLKPAPGSKHRAKRVGRGIGCTWGKTCGKGHKGQKARTGGGSPPGFEGGQMPLQRRLPKFGFTSLKSLKREEVRLSDLTKLKTTEVDMAALHAAGLVRGNTKYVKVIFDKAIDKAITLKGIKITQGAKKALESAGGKLA
ncbi:MAG: 50S ribosomal protein L15 [Gammaproteobacteria bacterium RIFCSPHIGHO2_02_FULL_42_13]|nr:MAG: 50S ribosomal protein L15 [Gammaproteobacteria bacterium RIFCSPHIGHO2_02_FULL_42_13]OGT68466.1 MAG: 50S ribosomal protein L15 [Gammaproteobacteria bacterium RIFCSPLOWO2_02_FULL_42_9]